MRRLVGMAFGVSLAALAGIWLDGPSPWSIGLPCVALAALVMDGVARPASGWLVPTISRGPREGGRVALTFDDGPDPEITPRVAQALTEAGARATFFCIGRFLEAHPEVGRALVAAGHELGNHSYTHSRVLNFRLAPAMEAEIARGAEVIRGITGAAAEPVYRPPMGLRNPSLEAVARRRRLRVVNWSLKGRDYRDPSPHAIALRVLRKVRPGDIVLLHDGCDRPGADRRPTAAAVPLILEGLRVRGLRCVTVSELIGRDPGPGSPG